MSEQITLSRLDSQRLCSLSSIQRLFHLPRLLSHWTCPLYVGELVGIAVRANKGARGVFLIIKLFSRVLLFQDAYTSAGSSNSRNGRSRWYRQ